MTTRRNMFIRLVAGVTGDFAVGFALGLTCTWIIEAAALGLFLSFLLWIVALVLGLALSQNVVHPAVRFVLSDRKLDQGIEALASVAQAAADLGLDPRALGSAELRRRFSRFATRFRT